MEPGSSFKLKFSVMGFTHCKRTLKILVVSVVMLLLLVGVFVVVGRGKAGDLVGNDCYYTVVVDCGSSGTRVSVYKWRAGSLSNWFLPDLVHSYPDDSTDSLKMKGSCTYHCLQTEPGLDKFVGNATGVRISLEPLLELAEKWVPRERHRDTPIFVLATAGLRRLEIEDARWVLDDVEDVVKDRSFVYKRSWIRVLSGEEEAYYGWLALNYKMDRLGNSSKEPTLGLLDLGGSSLQVVVGVDGELSNKETHLIRSKLGLVEHWILAYSLPLFGLNEAFDRTVAMLSTMEPISASNNGRLKIRHPCLNSDSVQNYTCHSCRGNNITDQKDLDSEHIYTYLVGEPDWEKCKEIARTVATNSSSYVWPQPIVGIGANCKKNSSSHSGLQYPGGDSLNLKAISHPNGRFHALSGFFAVYNKLNLAPVANVTKIWEKGQQLCSQSLADTDIYTGQYCFKVPYIASLIEDALCLSEEEIIFGPGDLSWTLGAALAEGEYLWLRSTEARHPWLKKMKVMYSPIFVLFLLLCLLFTVYHCQIKLPMVGQKKVPAVGLSLPSYIYPKRRPN